MLSCEVAHTQVMLTLRFSSTLANFCHSYGSVSMAVALFCEITLNSWG